MKYIRTYETFVSPSVQRMNLKQPVREIVKKQLAWLLPTDDRFKNLFKTIKPLNHFKYPFGNFSNFINEPDEEFIIITYKLTNLGENWNWFAYEGEETLNYLKYAKYDFQGPVGLKPEEYDDALISLTANKYNL